MGFLGLPDMNDQAELTRAMVRDRFGKETPPTPQERRQAEIDEERARRAKEAAARDASAASQTVSLAAPQPASEERPRFAQESGEEFATRVMGPARKGGGGSRSGRMQIRQGQQQIEEARTRQGDLADNTADAYDDLGVAQEAMPEKFAEADAQAAVDREEAQDAYAEKVASIDAERDGVEAAASAKVDTGRFWKEAEGLDKMGMVVGNIFSAIGSGLIAAGGGGVTPNAAAQVIQKRASADVDAQKADIQTAMSRLERLGKEKSDLYRELQDNLASADLAYNRRIQAAKAQLDAQAAKTGSVEAANTARAIGAKLQERTGSELRQQGEKKVASAAAAARRRASQRQALIMQKEKQNAAERASLAKLQSDRDKRSIPGFSYERGDGIPEKQAYNNAVARDREYTSILGEVRALKSAVGQLSAKDRAAAKVGYETEAYKRVSAKKKELVEKIAKASGGVITDSDRRGAEQRLGDVGTGIVTPNETAALDELENIFSTRRNQDMATLGYEPLGGGAKPKSARPVGR